MPPSAAIVAICSAAVAWFAGRFRAVRSQREAERRLDAADAHLRALVDHSSAAIYLKDRAHRYLLANRRHMELWPQMRDFRPGMTPHDFFPEDVARSFGESDDAVWCSGGEYTFEETIPQADGVHTFVSSKFPVRDGTGRTIAVGGVSTDVTELRSAQENIARKELVLRRLIEMQENEKRRLCHEFHDGLIQSAVGSKMLLESLDRSRLPTDCLATIDAVVSHLARGVDDGRRVIRGIRPAPLDDLGLSAALEELCGQTRSGSLLVETEIDASVDRIPAGLQTGVYRIVQESLANVARHARAQRASVSVSSDRSHVEVVVADSGCGFEPGDRERTGFGLIGMEERVRLAGGEFAVESAPGAGTRLTARLPLP